jgi:hypothetical protein
MVSPDLPVTMLENIARLSGKKNNFIPAVKIAITIKADQILLNAIEIN